MNKGLGFIEALGGRDPQALHLLRGQVQSYNATTRRATVTIGGSTTTCEVPLLYAGASWTPTAGHIVWMISDGQNVIILGRQV